MNDLNILNIINFHEFIYKVLGEVKKFLEINNGIDKKVFILGLLTNC